MLVEFSVGNFLSFKDEVTFSMVGHPPIKEHELEEEVSNTITDRGKNIKILKSGVLYGANGSGKSNLVKALVFFKTFILTSSNDRQATDEIKVLPFLFSSETENAPSSFEMIFYIKEVRYRYGFEADKKQIHAEWFFLKNANATRETKLFTREFKEISINNTAFKEGRGLEGKTRANALFLSLNAQLDGVISTLILTWFKENINIISGLKDDTSSYTAKKFLEDRYYKESIIEFFKNIEIGFDDIEILEIDELIEKSIQQIPEELTGEIENVMSALKTLQEKASSVGLDRKFATKNISIDTLHKKFDSAGNFLKHQQLPFRLESDGTRKIFNLLGPIIDTVQHNKILIIDELDSRLHTLLTLEIIKFFHHKKNAHAQLIFASHDTNLLKKEIFRRDQIWFAEKDTLGATDLYSLVEYKINQAKVRNDASFEKDYLIGKYGAIPFLGNITQFIDDYLYEHTNEQKTREKIKV